MIVTKGSKKRKKATKRPNQLKKLEERSLMLKLSRRRFWKRRNRKPPGIRPSGYKPTDNRLISGDRQPGNRPPDNRPSGYKPTDNRPISGDKQPGNLPILEDRLPGNQRSGQEVCWRRPMHPDRILLVVTDG